MKSGTTLQLVAVVTLLWVSSAVAASKESDVYHWTDNEGVMHYGDRVPPEFAATGHIVLNEQGVEIDRIDGEKTAEEKAEEKRRTELATIEPNPDYDGTFCGS